MSLSICHASGTAPAPVAADRAATALLRRNRHLDLLARTANRLLVGTDPAGVVREVFDDLAEELGTGLYFNFMVDPADPGTLLLAHAAGAAPRIVSAFARLPIGLEASLCSIIAQERTALALDIEALRAHPAGPGVMGLGARAYIGHPMIAHGHLIGTLGYCLTERDGFEEDEVALARAVSDQVAAAMERARLMHTLEDLVAERTAELEAANARLRAEVVARETAQAEAAQAQKMQALGQLAGGVAHDLNNVLQAVAGGAAIIARRSHDPEHVRRIAGMLTDATARGSAVTGRLLAFARRGDLEAVPVDAAAMLGGLREILASSLGANIAVEVVVPASLPLLLADRGQLEAALVNLATNARDAMADGGTLTLAAGHEEVGAEGSAGTRRLRPGRYLRLSVADTGAGIPPEVLARVTEPFFTTKSHGKGTGLGLSMAKGFAEQSGGALAIESAPGRGTTVTVWLSEAMPLAEPGPAPAEARVRRPGARVLVVDDQALVREMLVVGLADRGFSVAAAANGQEALDLLDAGEAVDALLTDLSMPGIDGLQVIRGARERRAGLPAILLTGYVVDAARGDLSAALGRGPFDLLRKPADPDLLAARLAAMLEEGQACAAEG